jgi:hypothetical protein
MALSPTLNRGWKSLLDRGWNLNSIDLIESLQGRPMTSRESQAFYSFLRCSAPPLDAPAERVPPPLSIMQTIQRAEKRKLERDSLHEDASSTGHRAHAIVQVRRVQRVEVSNPDEQRWLGASHYFQLDGFADIGNSRITIRYEQSGEPIVFEKEFPITLVARNVPADLLIDAEDAIPGDAQAWYPRTRVAIEGWVYRMWRFKTTQVSEATGDKELQQGPMLIVDRFATPPDPPSKGASNLTPAWVTGITTGIGVLGGLWILWQIRHHAKVPRRSRR